MKLRAPDENYAHRLTPSLADATIALRTRASAKPIIITGHQPEFFHPGVWLKNVVAARLAKAVGGVAINLIVDSDLIKSPRCTLPSWPDAKPCILPFDDDPREMPYESHRWVNREQVEKFRTHWQQQIANWPFEPIGFAIDPRQTSGLAEWSILERRHWEQKWGIELLDQRVSEMAQGAEFQAFAAAIALDHERFRGVYNRALADYRREYRVRSRNHPAPDLAADELPFWRIVDQQRVAVRARESLHNIRPRALTLTLFARLHLGDWFIHGLGGGLYERVNDQIIRDYFSQPPPGYQIVTGTLRLPFPLPSSTRESAQHWNWYARHTWWNPHRITLNETDENRHAAIVAMPMDTNTQRQARYRAFRALAEELRPRVQDRQAINENAARLVALEWQQREFLSRRDYPWFYYPVEELQRFFHKLDDL